MALIKINGKNREFSDEDFPNTLSKLLKQLGIQAQTIVAEIDGKIVARKDFNSAAVNPKSNIELIRFVGGG